ncbi:1,4-dihydroxy-2-naphthoate polyprenyltransferase [Desnuesiella massiliensis]|uniref:1,4-dihydroxy-2-naphthoate polyprenyltransferase n=1 Tax=Desnuesiella massiliensis TaxID=1650662 RepID=UPI0006E2851E|nr:1,4-dihydroxy-2-naphthoate polyprenyltransferase [Desnuesiella massiliensis]
MNINSFLKLVEIQTKVASMIPFTLGTFYSLYRFKSFNAKNFTLMLGALLAFDMATTAINNYYDFKKAQKTHGYGYEKHNAIVRFNLKESTVVLIIISLVVIASLCGFMLFLNTNYIVLILGVISFGVGVLYSFGPLPISRMPLGELFSGLFMGFLIPFISTYIHIYDKSIVSLSFLQGTLNIKLEIIEIIYLFLISLPAICGIANIMLANNICDIEEDIENKRYTLPVYIGKEKALQLFKILYYIAYIDIAILLFLKVEPILGILVFLTFVLVSKNIKLFYQKQTKKDTFILAVKNFVIINVSQVLCFAIICLL